MKKINKTKASLNILVIDDNPEHREEAIASLIPRRNDKNKNKISIEKRIELVREFFNIKEAIDPDKAKEIIFKENFIPDLIILDIVFDNKGKKLLSFDFFEELKSMQIFENNFPSIILYTNQYNDTEIYETLSNLNLTMGNNLVYKLTKKGKSGENLEINISNALIKTIKKRYLLNLKDEELHRLSVELTKLLNSIQINIDNISFEIKYSDSIVELKYLLTFAYQLVCNSNTKPFTYNVIVNKDILSKFLQKQILDIKSTKSSGYDMNGIFDEKSILEKAIEMLSDISERSDIYNQAYEITKKVLEADFDESNYKPYPGRNMVNYYYKKDFKKQGYKNKLRQLLILRQVIINYMGYYNKSENNTLKIPKKIEKIISFILLRLFLILRGENGNDLKDVEICNERYANNTRIDIQDDENNDAIIPTTLTGFYNTSLGLSCNGLKSSKPQAVKLHPPKIFKQEYENLQKFIKQILIS